MAHCIVVPLDGSSLAEKAVPYAITLAKAAGARLTFVRAILTAADFAPGAQEFNETVRSAAQTYLDGVVNAAQEAGLDAESMVSEDVAATAVLQAIEHSQADMVVMSTHGRSGMGRVVWGSVADALLHQVTVPVFLVPKNTETAWSATPLRFVVPLDGSPLAEEALPAAEYLATALNAELILVRAVEPDEWTMSNTNPWAVYAPYWDDARSGLVAEATTYLDGVTNRLSARGITASGVIGEFDGASEVIRRAVRENGAQAIIMASHGRSGPARTLMGSVADAVLRTSHVPVMITRPAAVLAEEPEPSTALVPAELRNVPLTLTASELKLARQALEHLANGSHPQADLPATFDLLARLREIELITAPPATVGAK